MLLLRIFVSRCQDISPEAIETCKRLTADYAANLHYVCAASLAFLREWSIEERGEIHLLYLDSFDYFDRASDWNGIDAVRLRGTLRFPGSGG
jgi:hypothetical protein